MHRISVVTLCGALALALVGCSPDKSADTGSTTTASPPPAASTAPPAGAAPDQKPESTAGADKKVGGDKTAVKDAGKDTKKAGGSAPQAGKLVTTASGLQYEEITVGTGPSPQPGQQVTVDYTGTLADGTKFDSSLDHGRPFTFPIGAGRVIKGWDEGVMSMKVGGKRKLIIPAGLAYGDSPPPGAPIPPGATLTFIVELHGVQ